jgi:hypothetical protein
MKISNLVHNLKSFISMQELNSIRKTHLLKISSRTASTLTVLTKVSYGFSQSLQADVKIALQIMP